MLKGSLVFLLVAASHLACKGQPSPSKHGPLGASIQQPMNEELPILVTSPAEAERHSGNVVRVRGRSVLSTFRGLATPALELPTGDIVVLEPKSGATLEDLRGALEARPRGSRFQATGKMRMLAPKESQREVAILTLEGLPSANLAATPDEITTGLWPASTPLAVAVAPMMKIPLGDAGYAWWSLYRGGAGALFLESDAFGRHAIDLDEPVDTVDECVALDADKDSLFELVLLLTTRSGKKRAIVVGAGGRRIAALEEKLGTATTEEETYRRFDTFHWRSILGGPNGASVARVLWDEASLGAAPLAQLRLSGMRFYTTEEIMTRDGAPPRPAMLRVRAENRQAVVEARCGTTWKTVLKRDAPEDAPLLPTVLTAARGVVDTKGSDAASACAP